MRPFPRANPDPAVRKQLWESYRQELISSAGVCVLVLGNKKVGDDIALADGVRREFEIAVDHGLNVVPIGATGYMARELWNQVAGSMETYYPGKNSDLKGKFDQLGNEVEKPAELISRVLDFITLITKE